MPATGKHPDKTIQRLIEQECDFVAARASALAEGAFVGPRQSMVRSLFESCQRLAAWVEEDSRSERKVKRP